MEYKVILEPQEEAMINIKEAIELYQESIRERGLPFPQIEERKIAV